MLFALLAEAGGLDVTSITPVVSALGSVGFAIWFGWYVITKTIPDQQKEHRDQITELTERFDGITKSLLEEMRANRDAYNSWRMTGVK
jgi:hypothetical protein